MSQFCSFVFTCHHMPCHGFESGAIIFVFVPRVEPQLYHPSQLRSLEVNPFWRMRCGKVSSHVMPCHMNMGYMRVLHVKLRPREMPQHLLPPPVLSGMWIYPVERRSGRSFLFYRTARQGTGIYIYKVQWFRHLFSEFWMAQFSVLECLWKRLTCSSSGYVHDCPKVNPAWGKICRVFLWGYTRHWSNWYQLTLTPCCFWTWQQRHNLLQDQDQNQQWFCFFRQTETELSWLRHKWTPWWYILLKRLSWFWKVVSRWCQRESFLEWHVDIDTAGTCEKSLGFGEMWNRN